MRLQICRLLDKEFESIKSRLAVLFSRLQALCIIVSITMHGTSYRVSVPRYITRKVIIVEYVTYRELPWLVIGVNWAGVN